jgi:hypothetical protein
MPDPHWETIKAIFHAALGLSPQERAVYLEQASSGDVELRQAIWRMDADGQQSKNS